MCKIVADLGVLPDAVPINSKHRQLGIGISNYLEPPLSTSFTTRYLPTG